MLYTPPSKPLNVTYVTMSQTTVAVSPTIKQESINLFSDNLDKQNVQDSHVMFSCDDKSSELHQTYNDNQHNLTVEAPCVLRIKMLIQ